LLYFLVLVGIIVILILLFFPKGRNQGPVTKGEPKVAPRSEVRDIVIDEDEMADEEDDTVTTELDDIIDELEEDRGR
ncbi:MAG: hypothetical protein KAJ35_07875, partial [Thermoplasmata archaeon]|nr:hypothetical protein [Thermoplasmata archaeon]